MRIPIPERVSIWQAGAFALVLCVLQLACGTNLLFSLFCVAFILTAALAFNVAGGLTRPSGAYVFFFSTIAVIIGLVAKTILGEPAQSHLRVPNITIEAYAGGMFSMLLAVALSRRFSREKGLLEDILPTSQMRMATIGCLVAGIGLPLLAALASSAGESVFTPVISALSQLNRFLQVAIILGVTYEIRSSGGRRCWNLPVAFAMGYVIFFGAFLSFSKEALFAPIVVWLVTCMALGFRFTRNQLLGGVLVVLFFVRYMVPFCQLGRNYRNPDNTFAQNFAISYDLFLHLGETKRLYDQESKSEDREETKYYFDAPQGLLDRLQMVSIDDSLNEVTVRNGPLGLTPIYSYIANFVPRVLWRNKTTFNWTNYYAHETGIVGPEDYTTSISFSPVGEAYHLGGWMGVFVLAPIVWTVTFLIMDSLCGDLRRSPWGILGLAFFSFNAPEGLLSGCFYIMSYGAIIIIFIAFFSAYLLPLLGALLLPQKAKFTPFAATPAPLPSRLRPAADAPTPTL